LTNSFTHSYSRIVAVNGFSQRVSNPLSPASEQLASYNSCFQAALIPVAFGTSTYTVNLPVSAIPTAVVFSVTTAFSGGTSPAISVGSTPYISTTPATPVITNGGTAGVTSYSYKIAGFDGVVGTTAASSAGSTTTGNATLNGTNFNIITETTVVGEQYNVYRTVGGATQGLIGTFTATSTTSVFNDTGLTATGTTPSTNTTGGDLLASTSTSAQFIDQVLYPAVRGNGQTVYVTITGSPTAGAGYIIVSYINPPQTVNNLID
jgi:hypothetical protein